MSDDETRAVAQQLRALVETLVDRQPHDAARALELLRETAAQLDGPRRQRYYEREDPIGAAGFEAFLEHSPFGGRSNPLGPPVALTWSTTEAGEPLLEARLTLGAAYEGAPHCVHGGFVAAFLDDVFGMAQHALQVTAATGSLTVRFVAPTPVGRELTFRAWFDDIQGRRLRGHATCSAGTTVTARAEGLFIQVDIEQMSARSRSTG